MEIIKKEFTKIKKPAFTLSEALITLVVIGVVATITIPSIVSHHQEVQYKTGLKKAVKTINEGITMNIAKGEKSALKTSDRSGLYEYLQKNIEVIKSTTSSSINNANYAFYTPDGMRFEIPDEKDDGSDNAVCGTYGLDIGGSASALAQKPCVITVDINGDKKPNRETDTALNDIIKIIVTDRGAYPYGVAAQKVFYNE